MPLPKSIQFDLSKSRRQELAWRIENDWSLDSRDMEQRNNAHKRWYRLWRAVQEPGTIPNEERANFHIPLIQWQCLAKLAKEIDALLGDDAEIVVRPRGPSDAELAPKIARYMNWRVKQSLKLFKKMYDYLHQKIVLGTSIAYMPYATRKRIVKVEREVDTGKKLDQTFIDSMTGLVAARQVPLLETEWMEESIVEYDGPDFILENLEDWAIPPNTKDIDQADHFERRLRLSVDELLNMVDEGKLDSDVLTSEVVAKLRRLAETGQYTDESSLDAGKELRDEKKEQSGQPIVAEGRDDKLTVINWFGRYRFKDAEPLERAEELVAFWQPESRLILGTCKLVDISPDGRRGFVKSELVRDVGGGFWGIGLPEFLESINREMDIQHSALTDASVVALGPLIFYEPISGFNPSSFRYDGFQAVPTANAAGVKVVNLGVVNPGPFALLQNQLLNMSERLSGLTESEMGRPFTQPNAPRTLGQQQILSAGSGVRLLLDLRLERESLRAMINRVWELDKRFAPKPLWFRVSESTELEELTAQDMEGDFDFDIGPLSGTANKFEEATRVLQAHALALQNPITATSPVYLAESQRRVNTILGQEHLNAFIPDMSQMAPPKSPDEENAILYRGNDVDPHPADNHLAHIAKHQEFAERIQNTEVVLPVGSPVSLPAGTTFDRLAPGVAGRIQAHIAEHQAMLKGGVPSMAGISSLPQNGGGGGGVMPTDPSGQPAQAMNDLKSILNLSGLNLA